MSISIDSPTSVPVISTTIGVLPVDRLNNWNNTAFSQLCLSKSDDMLLILMKSPMLSTDKQEIAVNKFAERHGNQV